jgi:hypothetical protein
MPMTISTTFDSSSRPKYDEQDRQHRHRRDHRQHGDERRQAGADIGDDAGRDAEDQPQHRRPPSPSASRRRLAAYQPTAISRRCACPGRMPCDGSRRRNCSGRAAACRSDCPPGAAPKRRNRRRSARGTEAAPQAIRPPRIGRRLMMRRSLGGGQSLCAAASFMNSSSNRSLTLPLSPRTWPSGNCDADDIGRRRALAQQAVIEGEFAHQIHRLGQRRAVGESGGIGRVANRWWSSAAVEAGKVGAGILRHLLDARPGWPHPSPPS